MKTSIKNSLVVIAMLGAITSYANLMPSNTISEDIKMTTLTLENLRVGQRLLIKSDNGTILYKESISQSGDYQKKFDLTALPDGAYFFEVDKDFEIKTIPFIVKGSVVTFKKEAIKSIFKPVVTLKDGKILISKLSLNLEELHVEIYYDSGKNELIHSETITNTKNIQKAYKLLENVEGNYKIVCKTEDRVFVSHFKV